MLRIGLISDTHGLLRPEAMAALAGSDHVIHAGDIGDTSILDALRTIAPVTAVLGNCDSAADFSGVGETEVIEQGGVLLHVLHDLGHLEIDPRAAAYAAVISGHTHEPLIERRNGVLFINPGSAGPRRFSLPVSAGKLLIDNGIVTAQLVPISV